MNPMITFLNRLNTVKVRLSDAAVLAGAVSLLYALALVVFPRAFPELLHRILYGGHIFPLLGVLLVATNEILFLILSKRRAQKLDLLTSAYIAFLTIAIVFIFRLLVAAADAQAQISHLLSRTYPAGADEVSYQELLVYTHLAIVSGMVLPYLLVRLTQNYVSGSNSADYDAKVRSAAAGQ
jgi:hypothetical protein